MRRRRAVLAGAASVAVVGVGAAVAWGAPANIVGQADNTFNASAYSHDGGTVAQLVVGGSTHNATASATGPDGKALFRSNTISSGNTPVNGTQYLSAGSYPFICTIHPTTMQATLNVTGTGLPRPTVDLAVTSRKLAKVLKKGKLAVKATTTGAPEVALTAALGKRTIATGTVPAGGTTAALKLTKPGRQALAGKDKATVKVTGSIDFGAPDTVKAKLK
ncbi:MAG: cupredoxin domain-containing protein [Solirubrobacterales bacterium]